MATWQRFVFVRLRHFITLLMPLMQTIFFCLFGNDSSIKQIGFMHFTVTCYDRAILSAKFPDVMQYCH